LRRPGHRMRRLDARRLPAEGGRERAAGARGAPDPALDARPGQDRRELPAPRHRQTRGRGRERRARPRIDRDRPPGPPHPRPGYGRVDLRLDEQGRAWILDVNPNPDLNDDAGLSRMARAAGWDYAELVRRIAEVALREAQGEKAALELLAPSRRPRATRTA